MSASLGPWKPATSRQAVQGTHGDRFHHSPARPRRSPAPSARRRARPAPASNICSPPRRSNPISIRRRRQRPPRPRGSTSSSSRPGSPPSSRRGRRSATANYADAITPDADGRYAVADPNMRAAIMRLRSDPAASAMMAGAFTRTNAAQLAGAIGRQPSRRRTLHRAFPRPRRRGQADRRRGEPAASQRRRHVSAGRGGKPQHLLRPLRPAAQRRRGLCQADRPLTRSPARSPLRRASCAAPPPRCRRRPTRAGRRHRRRYAQAYAQAARNAGAGRRDRRRKRGRCSSPCSPTAPRPRGDADREQSVGAGRRASSRRPAAVAAARSVHRRPAPPRKTVRRQGLRRARGALPRR